MFPTLKPDQIRAALLALAYFSITLIGNNLAHINQSATLFWSPCGIALAALLLFGRRLWCGIFIGAWLANWVLGLPVLVALGIALASSAGAVLGATLLRRDKQFNRKLTQVRDVFQLALRGGLLGGLCAALIGCLSLSLGGVQSWSMFLPTLTLWCLSYALSVVVFAPAALSYALHHPSYWTERAVREVAALFGVLLLAFLLVFSPWSPDFLGGHKTSFVMFPIVVWAAMRFNMRVLGSVLFFAFLSADFGMLNHSGRFAQNDFDSVLDCIYYILVLALVGLSLSVISYQRGRVTRFLNDSKSSLKQAQAIAHTGSWHFKHDRYFFSDEACRILSIPFDQPLTKEEFLDFVYPADQALVRDAWVSAVRGQVYDVTHRLSVDGKIKWVRQRAQLQCDDYGVLVHGVGSMQDITPRKLAELERERSERMLKMVLDNVPVRIFWKDKASRFLGANGLVLNDAGLARFEQMVGKKTDEIFPGQEALYDAYDQEVLSSGVAKINAEVSLATLGELRRTVLLSKVPLLNDQSEIIGVLGMYTDITERKEAEDAMRLAAKVFESAGESILITNADKIILAVNQAFTRMAGYSVVELRGKTPRMLASGEHDDAFYNNLWRTADEYGHWSGEIMARDKAGRIYPKQMTINAVKNEQGAVTHYVAISQDISERKQAERQVEFLAYYDVLTGLPNRTLLRDRLTQLIAISNRDKQNFAVLFLDLDRFKYINDSMGHSVGDRLLQSVAERVQQCVREGDTVSRIGGDEFIVLLRDTNADAAIGVAEKILQALSRSFKLDKHEISTQASIGISVYPEHANDVDNLIKNADAAMYRAKDKGRNNCQVYVTEMNLHAHNLFVMEQDLRHALDRKEFELHYQPQVDLKTGRICGVEALIRWNHPKRGLLNPAEFISIAEETGQILAIGEWVLRTACAQLAKWRWEGWPKFPIAVNLSVRQLTQANMAELVLSALQDAWLNADDLELEITEGMMMGDPERALAFLTEMNELGVQLSIDDFGTGYSSLNYLKKLPVNKLKVDQTFVRDIMVDESDATIVRSVVKLGHRFNLRVIAEGVETLAQLDFLRECGCNEIQGYHFSRPLAQDDFEHFMQHNPRLRWDWDAVVHIPTAQA